jgi:hypothetical protein
MTENTLMIPDAASVPAHIKNPELAKQANEDAAAGISTGIPARVKLSGKQFALVDGNGEETPYPPASLIPGPDGNTYMPMIVLRAKKALTKTWYAAAYNPDGDAVAPDCFSNDGEKPDASVAAPQADTCATCAYNAFGSGKDQNGNPTKGKACTDSKILAVFVPQYGIHSFKIPPASLKNFGLYVKHLSAAGIPVGAVKTLVGFDLTATFPVVVFQFGGYVDEKAMGKLAELAESSEVAEIISGITVTQAAPAPKQVEAPKKEEPVVETPPVTTDDLGLGLTPEPPAPKEPEIVDPGGSKGAPTDAELMAELGL